MGSFGYIQINMFAALMLLILYFNSKSKFPYSRNSKRFRKIMIMLIAVLVMDTTMRVLDGQDAWWNGTMMWITVFVYYTLIDVLALGWFVYTYANIYEDRELIEDKRLVFFTLAPLLALLLVMTCWPGLIFDINERNHYVKGQLFPLQYGAWMLYMIVAAGMAFFLRKNANTREKREECVCLAYFPALPLLGGMIQRITGGMATAWPFTVASVVMVYVKMQRTQISLDPMTGLNNRNRFNQYIQSKIDNDKGGNSWYLLLIDIDDFKQINDAYGHMAGDEALKKMAVILKRAFGRMNAFLARFGGDEFVVVLDCKRDKDLQNALILLEVVMNNENRHDNARCQLSCSVGCVKYDGEVMKTKEELIAAADREMYFQKRNRKAQGT